MVTSNTATGMAEQAMAWPVAAPAPAGTFEALWGALAGRIHVAEGSDLAAPTGETWEAAAGEAVAGRV